MPIISGASSGSGTGTPTNGWVQDNNIPTYASASTFTAGTSDLTAVYTAGTRLKFTQTTVKYFLVVSSSFGAGTTTVTIAVSPDYTLANAAITSPFYSYAANPSGWPQWFNWTPGWTGYSANPTVGYAKFSMVGKQVTLIYNDSAVGTSNATTLTITGVPVPAAFAVHQMMDAVDNGVNLSAPSYCTLTSTTITCNKVLGGSGGWTNPGGKAVEGIFLTYSA